MKVKNLNPVEMHIDKLVLLICLVGLGYSVWNYIVSDSFTLSVANQPIDVGKVDSHVLTKAQTLKSEINKKAHAELTKLRPPDYPQQFNNQFSASLTPGGQQLARITLLENPNILGKAINVETGKRKYHVPDIKPPTELLVAAGMGTINPQTVSQQTNPQLLAILRQPPLDLQWVSLSCQFDAQALRDSLIQVPEDTSIHPLPPEWWSSTLAMVDVEMEREEKLPDGQWGNRKTVPALPDSIKGQFREHTEQVGKSYAKEMISSLLQYQMQIMQPPFPALINQQWLSPAEQAQLAKTQPTTEDQFSKDPRVQTLTKQIETVTAQLKQIQANIQRMENLNRPVSPILRQRDQQLQQKLQDLNRQLQERLDQLQSAQSTTTTTATATPTTRTTIPNGLSEARYYEEPPPPRPGMTPEAIIPGRTMVPTGSGGGLLNAQTLLLYAHDLTVESGKTYRYRVRTFIVNPLYGQDLAPDQAQYARKFKLASDWSDWSQPVQTTWLKYHFLLSAAQSTNSASVEIWRFTTARWYKAKFNVSPGDVIGGPTSTFEPLFNTGEAATVVGPIDMTTGDVVVDVDYNYPVQVGNITRNTTRLLYVGHDQNIHFLQQSTDKQRMEKTRETIKKRLGIQEVEEAPIIRQPIPQRVPRQPNRRLPYGNRLPGMEDQGYMEPPPPPPSRTPRR